MGLFIAGVLDAVGAIATLAIFFLASWLIVDYTDTGSNSTVKLDRAVTPNIRDKVTVVDDDSRAAVNVDDSGNAKAELEGQTASIHHDQAAVSASETSDVATTPPRILHAGSKEFVLYLIVVLGLMAFWFCYAIFLVFNALRMRQLRSYGMSMAGCILGIIPVHPGAIIGIPSGIVGLVALSKQRVFTAFEQLSQQTLEAPAKK